MMGFTNPEAVFHYDVTRQYWDDIKQYIDRKSRTDPFTPLLIITLVFFDRPRWVAFEKGVNDFYAQPAKQRSEVEIRLRYLIAKHIKNQEGSVRQRDYECLRERMFEYFGKSTVCFNILQISLCMTGEKPFMGQQNFFQRFYEYLSSEENVPLHHLKYFTAARAITLEMFILQKELQSI